VFATALRFAVAHHDIGANPLMKLANLSENELNAAFAAGIESTKQDSYQKLLKVHEIAKACALRDSRNRKNPFDTFLMPHSTLANFREGLGSRIGIYFT
jgi:hypothetical protein